MSDHSTHDVSEILKQRENIYGDFTRQAQICQGIKRVLQDRTLGHYQHLLDFKKQALDDIANKLSRIVTGDPNYADNWLDIQGYAKLVSDRLDKK